MICCICFSVSKPFRKAVWTNPLFCICVVLMTGYNTYLTVWLDDWSEDLFNLADLPMNYRYFLLAMIVLDFIATYSFERFFIQWFSKWWNTRLETNKTSNRAQMITELAQDSKPATITSSLTNSKGQF